MPEAGVMPPVRVRRHTRRRGPSTESPVYRQRPVERTGGGPAGDISQYGKYGTVGKSGAIVKGRRDYTLADLESQIRETGSAKDIDFAAESAVSTLDDLLRFNVVPPTAIREDVGGHLVSAQEIVPNSVKWWSTDDRRHEEVNKSDLFKIAIIDIIVNQGDRHGGNLLITPDNRAHAIDNEAIFSSYRKSVAVDYMWGKEIPKDILHKLKGLDKGDFTATFAGVGSSDDIEEAWDRKKHLEFTGIIDTSTPLED